MLDGMAVSGIGHSVSTHRHRGVDERITQVSSVVVTGAMACASRHAGRPVRVAMSTMTSGRNTLSAGRGVGTMRPSASVLPISTVVPP